MEIKGICKVLQVCFHLHNEVFWCQCFTGCTEACLSKGLACLLESLVVLHVCSIRPQT